MCLIYPESVGREGGGPFGTFPEPHGREEGGGLLPGVEQPLCSYVGSLTLFS